MLPELLFQNNQALSRLWVTLCIQKALSVLLSLTLWVSGVWMTCNHDSMLFTWQELLRVSKARPFLWEDAVCGIFPWQELDSIHSSSIPCAVSDSAGARMLCKWACLSTVRPNVRGRTSHSHLPLPLVTCLGSNFYSFNKGWIGSIGPSWTYFFFQLG